MNRAGDVQVKQSAIRPKSQLPIFRRMPRQGAGGYEIMLYPQAHNDFRVTSVSQLGLDFIHSFQDVHAGMHSAIIGRDIAGMRAVVTLNTTGQCAEVPHQVRRGPVVHKEPLPLSRHGTAGGAP